jgi:hypothetical protein
MTTYPRSPNLAYKSRRKQVSTIPSLFQTYSPTIDWNFKASRLHARRLLHGHAPSRASLQRVEPQYWTALRRLSDDLKNLQQWVGESSLDYEIYVQVYHILEHDKVPPPLPPPLPLQWVFQTIA